MTQPAEALDIPIEPKRMLDRYEMLAEIARGGMGTVYLARLGGAGGFERLFAIKLMHEHLAEEPAFVTMMLDEARTAAHIHHPNAVGIIDVRESAVGYYLVMSYVDGFSFSQILEHPRLDARTRMRISTRLLADAGHGLHAAHTARNAKGEKLGIVHRDVSPQNVLVGTDGTGRIVDFGIALAASRITASRPGMLKGKPSYMAPEQARGDVCDARADVFALGIVLWEALTDAQLFHSEMDLATLVKVMECVVEPPTKHVPDLPEGLSATVMKALQKDPGDRFASARELAVAIERAADAAGLLASTHEVEEVLADLFAHEITVRQAAVTRRLAASSGVERSLDRASLGTVPRLIPKKHGSSAEPDTHDLPATRSEGNLQAHSGVRESVASRAPVDPHAHTGMHDTPAPFITPSIGAPSVSSSSTVTANIESPAPRRSSGVLVGAVIGVVIALVVVAAAVLAMGGGAATVAEPTAAEPAIVAPAVAEPAIVAPAAVAPVIEPSAVVVPSTDVAIGLDPPVALEPAAVVAPVVAPAPIVEHGARRHARPVPVAPTAEPGPAGPASPELEVNPYLTH